MTHHRHFTAAEIEYLRSVTADLNELNTLRRRVHASPRVPVGELIVMLATGGVL